MKTIEFRIRGVAPLICHNAQLSDPLNPWTIAVAEISGKRKKTTADLMEMAHREFLGSLYLDSEGAPVIPGGNIERMLRDAAAKSKQGKQVQAGLIVMDDCPIAYEGPKDPEKLWGSGKHQLRASAKVGQQRVIRTRPCFMPWELGFRVDFDETILNERSVREFVEIAGRVVGLGDWRPKHGRFEVIA